MQRPPIRASTGKRANNERPKLFQLTSLYRAALFTSSRDDVPTVDDCSLRTVQHQEGDGKGAGVVFTTDGTVLSEAYFYKVCLISTCLFSRCRPTAAYQLP